MKSISVDRILYWLYVIIIYLKIDPVISIEKISEKGEYMWLLQNLIFVGIILETGCLKVSRR